MSDAMSDAVLLCSHIKVTTLAAKLPIPIICILYSVQLMQTSLPSPDT